MNLPALRGHTRSLSIAAGVAAITAYRLWLFFHVATRNYFDKYWYFAGKLLDGTVPSGRLGDISAGYLVFVALVRWLGIGVPDLLTIQILLLTVAAVAVGLAAWKIAGPVAGIAAGIALFASREVFVAATDLEPEALIVTLVAVALTFLAFALSERVRSGFLLLAGLALGAAALMRPVPLVIGAGVLAWLAVRAFRRGNAREIVVGWKAPVAFALGLSIPVLAGGIFVRSLGHSSTAMDPAMAFYEGMSPGADGYTGEQPAIVKELQGHFHEPDSLHVTYRVIASRASGRQLGGDEANAFWLRRSLRFMVDYPMRAVTLVARKLVLSLDAHEVWDLEGMFFRAKEVGPLWLPFSVLGPLAILGLVAAHRNRDELAWLLTIVVLASGLHLVVFYVTSRQRNALVPAVALAAGLAVAWIVRERRHGLRYTVTIALTVAAMIAFSIPGVAQSEEHHIWTNYLTGERLVADAARVHDREARRAMLADARVCGFGTPVTAAELRRYCIAALPRATDPARRFDLAVTLQSVGEWQISGRVADDLAHEGYQPRRGSRTANSVSYLRFRALAHLGGSDAAIRDLLSSAARQAPGDPWILAAESVFENDQDARTRLLEIHDPFTSDLALAQAEWDAGNARRALELVRKVRVAVPEWDRAREIEALIESSR